MAEPSATSIASDVERAVSTPWAGRARRARAIVNPVSGRHDVEATSAQLRSVLRDYVSDLDVRVTREGGDAYRWAADAADLGVDLLVVVGGDGTVAAVLDGARRRAAPVPVAIVPLGTANGVARAMGIPATGLDVLPKLLRGRVVPVDLFEVEASGRAFVLFLGAGFDAEVNADAPRASKRRFGLLAYVGAAVRRLWGRSSRRIELGLDGRSVRTRGHSVSVVNVAPVNVVGVPVGPQACATDGLLDVTVLRRSGPAGVLLDTIDLLTGRAHRTRAWQARRVTIDASPPLRLHADGDVIGTTPVTVRAVPHGARLLVPQEAGAAPA